MSVTLYISQTDENLQGKSHWWGAPDLPAGMQYPFITLYDDVREPLTFVCQIRCEEIAQHDTTKLLPDKGMLYIFAPIAYFTRGYGRAINYKEKPVIIYIEDCSNLYPHDIVSDTDYKSIFRPALKISFSRETQNIEYAAQMLCPPNREEISAYNSGKIVLLQIEEYSKWNLRIFDCGTYHILMRPEDIKNGNWENVTSDVYSY